MSRAAKRKKWTPLKLPRVVSTPEEWEAKAISYAKWLMLRDEESILNGSEYPRLKARVVWAGVYVKAKSGRQYYEKRISGVEWGYYEDVYNTKKNGQQGAFLYKKWTCERQKILPNWDWQPDVIDLSTQIAAIAA